MLGEVVLVLVAWWAWEWPVRLLWLDAHGQVVREAPEAPSYHEAGEGAREYLFEVCPSRAYPPGHPEPTDAYALVDTAWQVADICVVLPPDLDAEVRRLGGDLVAVTMRHVQESLASAPRS